MFRLVLRFVIRRRPLEVQAIAAEPDIIFRVTSLKGSF